MAKFCGNCGAQLGDNETFCGSCGAAVNSEPAANAAEVQSENPVPAQEQPQAQAAQAASVETQTYEQPQSMPQSAPAFNNGGASVSGGNKNVVKIAVAAAAAAAVIIAAAIVIKQVTKYEKIDAKDLVYVDFSGPEGYGECTAFLNVDPDLVYGENVRMPEAYKEYVYKNDDDAASSSKSKDSDAKNYSKYLSSDKKTLKKAYEKAKDDYGDAKDMRDAILDTEKVKDDDSYGDDYFNYGADKEYAIKIKASKTEGLKNGDKVKITVEYDEDTLKEANVKLTNTEFEVEVKGLDQAETIDPFDGVNVTFEGYEGDVNVDVDVSEAKYRDLVSYDYDYSYGADLKNGDTYTVTASIYSYDEHYFDEDDKSKGFWFESNVYDENGEAVKDKDGKTKTKCYIWPFEEKATKDYKVEGLQGLDEIDPFAEGTFTIDYSGALPYLHVTGASAAEDSKIKDYVSYSIENYDYDRNYKAGDTFTVTCYAYSSLAEAGYKLKGETNSDGYYVKEYTIDEATAPKYLSSTSTKADTTSADEIFKSKAEDYKDNISGSYLTGGISLEDSVKTVDDMKEIGQYVINPEGFESGSIADSTYNYYGRIYEISMTLKDKKKATAYVYIYDSNIMVEDGKLCSAYNEELSADDYFNTVGDTDLKKLLKTLKEEGTVTELPDGSSGAAAATDSSSTADESAADSSAADSKAEDSSLVP